MEALTTEMISILLILHVGSGLIAFILSFALAIMAYRTRRDKVLSQKFWVWQNVLQILVLVLGLTGTILFMEGSRPKVIWHLLYGALALVTLLAQRALGRESELRRVLSEDYGRFKEVWVYFGLNLFLWAMIGRGITTGFFGF